MFKRFFILILLFNFLVLFSSYAQNPGQQPIKVGVAGSAPFVVNINQQSGISLEIWQAMAGIRGLQYTLIPFDDVPHAIAAMDSGKIDAIVGPISITSERAELAKFTQPYYQSSLSIMSRTEPPSLWERIKPFFSTRFFTAVLVFLCILAIVGTLLWLAEREKNPEQFPHQPARGIANGMWLAIVTMSTVGYGDKAAVTLAGRIITGCWIVISIIFATSMVAGIASTLTLTGLNSSVITQAKQLNGKKVAVVEDSPADEFIHQYGGKEIDVKNLEEGYTFLKDKKVDAIVYDRPQLLYFLKEHHDENVSVSKYEYMRQGYGFAVPLSSTGLHEIDIDLLKLQESGRVSRIVSEWLGVNNE